MAQKEQEANKQLQPLTTVISHSHAPTIIASIASSSAGASSIAKTLITPVTLPGTPSSISITPSTNEPKSVPHVPVAVTPRMASTKTFGGLIQQVPASSLVQVSKTVMKLRFVKLVLNICLILIPTDISILFILDYSPSKVRTSSDNNN